MGSNTYKIWTYLSCNKLNGYFEPGGNNGGGASLSGVSTLVGADLEELPAFPDFTIGGFLGILTTNHH